MDTNTNHLIKLPNQPLPESYERIPQELEPEAQRVLGDNTAAFITRHNSPTLTRWARKRRKAKRKAARKSRKTNRRRS